MTQPSASAQDAEAVLVGSLAAFSLPHVLTLAATSAAHGRLSVTATGVDGHLWLEDGFLTGFLAGDAATLTEAVFDLALVTDGWFSFFPGGETPAPTGRCVVADILADVEPQVAEWHELVARVSLDGLVHLSPTAPGDEVQIRADQWHLLTTISATGSRVRDVLDAMGSQYVVALRLVCELLDAGLIETLDSPPDHEHVTAAAMANAAATASSFPGASWVPPRPDPATATNGQPVPASDVEVIPPPNPGDPWVPPPLGHEPVSSQNGWSG
jgi:hypothetical protein